MPAIVIMALLIACNATNNSSETASLIDETDREVLREYKTLLWPKAYADQDTALLNQLLHKEFELVDDQGDTYSKQDELAYITKYGPSYDAFVFEITRLDLFENGTAVVTGVGTLTGKDDAGAYTTTYRSSNVLVKQDGRWQAINSHVSGVEEVREGS